MASVTFALGATADVASSSEVSSAADRVLSAVNSGRDPRPLYIEPAQSGQGIAAGVIRLEMGGPASGRVWDIRQLVLAGQDDSSTFAGWTVSTVGVAAAAGTATLPPGQAIWGFDIEVGPAASALTGVVTVTGTAFGTLSYQLSETTTGSGLSIRFPEPIPPLTPATSIVVNVPAIATGAAYTIDAYGEVQVAWYKAVSDQPGLPQLLVPRSGVPGRVPGSVVPASSKSLFLHFGDQLVALVYGLPVGLTATAIARVAEWPASSMESGRI